MTTALGKRGVFPLTVSDLRSLFSDREYERIRSAPQPTGNGVLHTDLEWRDVDRKCFASFITANDEREIEVFWINCAMTNWSEAEGSFHAWLQPFGVRLQEGATEFSGNTPTADIQATVGRDPQDGQWWVKLFFSKPDRKP